MLRRPNILHRLPIVLAMVAASIFLVGLVIFLVFANRTHSPQVQSPVPASFRKGLTFPGYYPDPAKLPAGYYLVQTSFTSPETGVLVYAVAFPAGKLVLSLQEKPPQSDINSFNSQRIPIHYDITTPVGHASVGASPTQTIISLPTNSNCWIIATGPSGTRRDTLTTILNSLRK